MGRLIPTCGNDSRPRTAHRLVLHGEAFVDDLTIFASSPGDLQKATDLVSEFNHLHCIKSNPSKSTIMAINHPPNKNPPPITVTVTNKQGEGVPVPIRVAGKSEFIQSLGGFYLASSDGKAAHKAIMDIFGTITCRS